jgi:hypothetical protein
MGYPAHPWHLFFSAKRDRQNARATATGVKMVLYSLDRALDTPSAAIARAYSDVQASFGIGRACFRQASASFSRSLNGRGEASKKHGKAKNNAGTCHVRRKPVENRAPEG